MSQPASPETLKTLYENMGKIIEDFSPLLKTNILRQEALDINIENNTSKILEALLSLNTYFLYMNIELASLQRACYRANLPAEKRYNIKYINCVILEGYKYLYGYKSKRRKSLWMSKIKPLLAIIPEQEFEKDYKELENQIIEFGENNITNHEQRNLSFHYDREPISVYDMLIELSEETEAQRMILFLDLLQNTTFFVLKYIERYNTYIHIDTQAVLKYVFSFSDIDIFQNSKDSLCTTLEGAIKNNSIRLDQFAWQQGFPTKINQHFKDIDQDLNFFISQFMQVGKSAIQLTYLYIDLASASRAFISSEYVIEKQLSLKQINTIIYEGFNKLFGLEDNKGDSFWEKYIHPIVLDDNNKSTYEEFSALTEELNIFQERINKCGVQRQLSVHLDKGIVEVYNMLHNLDPIKEFQKALQFLTILPKVLNFFTKCLHIVDARRKTDYEKKMQPTYQKLDNLIDSLEKSPNTPQKEELMKMINKLKTGEFLDEILKKKK